jgi:RimJ/RimL family protein N-acetyltransferase
MKMDSWKKIWPWLKDSPVVRRDIYLEGELVVLRPKRMDDAGNDYLWRTDPELAGLDATRPINLTLREYTRYHRDDLEFPSPWSVRLAIDSRDGRHIGNCMYYDIDYNKHHAELGIMIGDREYWGKGYGTDAVRTLLHHVFTGTTIERIYLHTLADNARAQRAFEKAGFRPVKKVRRDGYNFVFMEVRRADWLRQAGIPEAERQPVSAAGETAAQTSP